MSSVSWVGKLLQTLQQYREGLSGEEQQEYIRLVGLLGRWHAQSAENSDVFLKRLVANHTVVIGIAPDALSVVADNLPSFARNSDEGEVLHAAGAYDRLTRAKDADWSGLRKIFLDIETENPMIRFYVENYCLLIDRRTGGDEKAMRARFAHASLLIPQLGKWESHRCGGYLHFNWGRILRQWGENRLTAGNAAEADALRKESSRHYCMGMRDRIAWYGHAAETHTATGQETVLAATELVKIYRETHELGICNEERIAIKDLVRHIEETHHILHRLL